MVLWQRSSSIGSGGECSIILAWVCSLWQKGFGNVQWKDEDFCTCGMGVNKVCDGDFLWRLQNSIRLAGVLAYMRLQEWATTMEKDRQDGNELPSLSTYTHDQ